MEKIIFFGLVIPIIGFVLYLGATAIMKGFSAKEENRSEKEAKSFENDLKKVEEEDISEDQIEKRMKELEQS